LNQIIHFLILFFFIFVVLHIITCGKNIQWKKSQGNEIFSFGLMLLTGSIANHGQIDNHF